MAADPQRVQALFHELVEQVPPAEWPARLAAACGDDDDLRRRVQALLDAHGAADSLLDAPDAPPPTLDHPGPLRVGSIIGPYKLLERLGAGGMGEVWVAHRRQPMQQLVALKLIKPGMDTAQVLARFEAERQALALMDHPNIAHVYDAGTTPDGRPYFVMELVKGVPITQYCDEHGLTVRQRLELFVPVCQAVQHAHQKGIIHRDLKPSNVLVAEYDDTPVPKVIDFGIAKSIAGALTAGTVYSEFGCILGTVQYMSPEQAKLNQLDVDTRSDVYSLGILLYELLTGTPPLEQERLKAVALDEVLRVIREEEPPKPSTRLSTSQALPSVAARRHAQPAELPGLVRGELDWIVMKALEKERKRRYESAASLAKEIQNHLHDRPVEACPPSVTYRLRKFVRRYRWPVAAGAAVLAALVVGLAGAIAGMVQAIHAAAAEARAKERAETLSARLLLQLYGSDMGEAHQAWRSGDLGRLEMLLRRHVPRPGEDDLRGFEWFHLWRLWKRDANPTRLELADSRSYAVVNLAVSADGSRIAVAHPDGPTAVTVLNPKQPWQKKGCGGEALWGRTFAALSGNGKVLAYWAKAPRTVVVQDLEKDLGKPIPDGEDVTAGLITPDGQTLVLGCSDGTTRLWDLAAWEEKGTLPPGSKAGIGSLAFIPGNSPILLTGHWDGTVCAWNWMTKGNAWQASGSAGLAIGMAGPPHPQALAGGERPVIGSAIALACSPQGNLVAVGGANGMVTIRDVVSGRHIRSLVGGEDEVRAVAFSPDGTVLAAASRDFRVRVWNVNDFSMREIISGYNGNYGMAFLADSTLAFGARAGGVALRPVGTDQYADSIPARKAGVITSLAFSPAGDVLLARDDSKREELQLIRITPTGVGRGDADLLELPCVPGAMAMSRTGLLAVGDRASARTYVGNFPVTTPLQPLPDGGRMAGDTAGVTAAAFSPSGQYLAVGLADGTVLTWDVVTKTSVLDLHLHDSEVRAICFCGDDKTLLTGGEDRTVKLLWDVAGNNLLQDLGPQADRVTSVAASRDGGVLAAGIGLNGSHARLWRRSPGRGYEELETPSGHFRSVHGVALLDGGRRLASASGDRTIQIWDISSRERSFTFVGGASVYSSVAVSPDERILAAGDYHGGIRLFRAASREEVQAVPGWWRRTEEDNAP